MKTILAVTFIAGLVSAEVPSHSYLPPPPRGYPQASSPPSVIAARTLSLNPDHQNNDHHSPDHHPEHGVAAVRSSPQPQDYSTSNPTPQGRYNDEQGYEQSTPGYSRNGLEDANTTVSYNSEEQGYPKSYENPEDLTRSTGYNENANNIRSNNGYNQDDRAGYQGNGQNGVGYNSNDQNGGRYQENQNGRSARSNFN